MFGLFVDALVSLSSSNACSITLLQVVLPKFMIRKIVKAYRYKSSLFLYRSVTDLRPRKLDVEQCTLLCNLAELVARGIEIGSSYITDSLVPSHAPDTQPGSGNAAVAASV